MTEVRMRLGSLILALALAPAWGARGRVKVVDYKLPGSSTKVKAVVDDQGYQLRGGETAWDYDRDDIVNYLAGKLVPRKMNLIKTYLWGDDAKGFQEHVDNLVKMYADKGVYVLISPNGTAGPRISDGEDTWWKVAAARYKDYTHVLYDIDDPDAAKQARKDAPNTCILTRRIIDGFDYSNGGFIDGSEGADGSMGGDRDVARAKGIPIVSSGVYLTLNNVADAEKNGMGWAIWIDTDRGDNNHFEADPCWEKFDTVILPGLAKQGLDWRSPVTSIMPLGSAAYRVRSPGTALDAAGRRGASASGPLFAMPGRGPAPAAR